MDDGHRMKKRRKRDDDGDGAETPGPANVATRAPEGVERHSAAAVAPLMAVATMDWEDHEPPAEREAAVTGPVSGPSALGAARGGIAVAPSSRGDRCLGLVSTIPTGGFPSPPTRAGCFRSMPREFDLWPLARGDRLVGSPVFAAGGDVVPPGPIGIGQLAAARAPTPRHRTLCARCGFGTFTVRFSPVEHLCLCTVCQTNNVNAVCMVCGLRGGFFS